MIFEISDPTYLIDPSYEIQVLPINTSYYIKIANTISLTLNSTTIG